MENTKERTVETMVNELVTRLRQQLAQQEDAETAIAVYKLCNWLSSQVDLVKQEALALAEQDLNERGLAALRSPVGSAGWTQPEVKQLDEAAWLAALAQYPDLRERQRSFDLARTTLQQAQTPYLKVPASRFFIR